MQVTVTPTNRTDITRKDCILESTANTSGDTLHTGINTGNFSNNGLLLVNLNAG